MATLGCLKCKKKSSVGFGKKIFAGFDRETWKKRSNEDHRNCAFRVRSCKTKTEWEKLESETGVKYCVLLGLPYYDAIIVAHINPMHNLFLSKEPFKFFKIITFKSRSSPWYLAYISVSLTESKRVHCFLRKL